jgi:hypothetical protein
MRGDGGNMTLKIILKGGPGSGHHGHAGRPGQRGGSVSGSVAMSLRTGKAAAERKAKKSGDASKELSIYFMNVPEGIYTANGWRSPSQSEKSEFVDALAELPQEIQDLWQNEHGLALAINPDEDLYGLHMTNWIILGTDSFRGPVARHEFTHHIVDQPSIRKNLRVYKPIQQFNHASRAPGGWERQQNEDLTMMLDRYSSDRTTWISNLTGSQSPLMEGGKLLTQDVAVAKVDSVISFMQEIGKWD